MRLQGLTPERPLTHDLFAGVLEELGATIREVVIADLADETFHARILLEAGGPSRDRLAPVGRAGARGADGRAHLRRRGGPRSSRRRGRRGRREEALDDERLSVFRDFVNSLDAEPGTSGPREGPPRE